MFIHPELSSLKTKSQQDCQGKETIMNVELLNALIFDFYKIVFCLKLKDLPHAVLADVFVPA